jgi:PAB-dependent poly(A)-specific ribonuclease subunit 2
MQIPAVLFYQRVDAQELLDFASLPLSADPAILCQDITISRSVNTLVLVLDCAHGEHVIRNRDLALIKHQPFKPDELPRRGTLVSIDAEFVSLQQASPFRQT